MTICTTMEDEPPAYELVIPTVQGRPIRSDLSQTSVMTFGGPPHSGLLPLDFGSPGRQFPVSPPNKESHGSRAPP